MTKKIFPLLCLMFLWLLNTPALYARNNTTTTIRIGILHSLTGSLGISGQSLVDAAAMAVAEVNASGGLLGKQVEMLVADGKSDWPLCAREAERLIRTEEVSAVFGCWTSNCRKSIKPVVEKLDNLLFYPVQYEGLEQSPNIAYTGATPNQQIIPGVSWVHNHLGRRLYLIGSDYIFPHIANMIIRDISKAQKGVILGEHYVPLGGRHFASALSEIRQLQPDAILNTVNGDSNHDLFMALHRAGLDHIPIISFSLSETEIASIEEARRNNHYAVWNYFQSIDSQANQRFVTDFKQRYGAERVIGDPMEASYISIKLWAQAVREARTARPEQVKKSLRRQSLEAPEGIISFDSQTQHLWKMVRIGQVQTDGQFKLVWQTKHPLRPHPFPGYRSRKQWQHLLEKLLAGKAYP